MAIQKYGVYAKASRFSALSAHKSGEFFAPETAFDDFFASKQSGAKGEDDDKSQQRSFSEPNASEGAKTSEEEDAQSAGAPKKKNAVFASYIAAHNARAAKIR